MSPGRSIGQMKYEMPLCLGTSGSVRAIRMPYLAWWAPLDQIFEPLITYSSPSRSARVREAGEVGPGVGFAEQLAPELLAAEDRRQEALLLLVGAGEQDRRRRPSDADRVVRPLHTPAAPQLVVDDQLVQRVGVESPRRRPVRHDVTGLGELGVRSDADARRARRGPPSGAGRRRPAGRNPCLTSSAGIWRRRYPAAPDLRHGRTPNASGLLIVAAAATGCSPEALAGHGVTRPCRPSGGSRR